MPGTPDVAVRGRRSLNPVWPAVLLVAAALATWVVTFDRMRGMDAGPGTNLGALGWFVGVWVTMMAAMMLPSVAPIALLYARVSRERERRQLSMLAFLGGYLAAWTLYGLGAYALYRGVRSVDLAVLRWDRAGPYVAGAAVAAAGLYELTALKAVCLRHCRTPFHFILHSWRDGVTGAVRMGAEHGAYCVGCCWGLMLILFAVGVMSVFWMAVVAALIFAEKVLPYGDRLTRVFAIAFVALGIWIAAG